MKIYEPVGAIEDADSLVGLSYGTSTHPRSPNYEIGQRMLVYADGRPLIADRTIVDAIPGGDQHMAHIVEGEVTNIKAQGVGTWSILKSAKLFMDEQGFQKPALFAQAWHMRRVIKQARLLQIDPIVPADMPTSFDTQSEQIWTRSLYLWLPFNALGSILLKKRGQL